jgi:hypothetical protein
VRHTVRAAVWSGAVVLATGVVAAPAFGIGRSAPAPSELSAPSALVRPTSIERAECVSDEAAATPAQVPTVGGGGEVSQALEVRVPRIAMVSYDSGDRIAAVATNTGCAPRAGDEVYVVLDDGNLVAAPDFALDGIAWRGDFTAAGVFQTQQG